ncbi:MAG: acyl-[acyl-carrier-protein]-phospholipid O-acyltransferase, partial [Candidatus Paceibacteria bacterium]
MLWVSGQRAGVTPTDHPEDRLFQLLRQRSFAALTLTQFLGAFNDNAFKQLVLLLSFSSALPWIAETPWVAAWGQSAALASFALPFILFGVLTGNLADRFSKRRVMIASNAAEVIVMILGGLAFALGRYEAVLVVLFLMGTQSSFFGPSKYGSIPELTEPRHLSRANGIIQMTTSIAIVMGTALGGKLFDLYEGDLMVAVSIFVSISVVGWLASLLMKSLPAAAPERRIRFNPFGELRRQLGLVRGDRALTLSLVASAFFYLVGAVLMLVINQYGRWLALSGGEIALLLAVLSLGIGFGSLLAAKLSGDRIESGLIPAGLVGMAFCTLGVLIAPSSVNWFRACLFATGLCAGLFSVPIRALIQHLPDPANRGSILGLAEVADFTGIFLAAGVFAVLNGSLGLTPPTMMAVMGGIILLFAAGSVFYTAEFALRFWLAIMIRTVYRVRTEGIGNVPRRGGALLVCNHLSFVDAFLVSVAVGRPVRFMMYRAFFDLPVVGHFARWVKAIPVSAEDGREAKQQSLQHAAQLLRQGELVCIFAEGSISRSGSLLGFRRGLERIARIAGTPILPVALDGVWGSIFSFDRGRFFWKMPKRVPFPVDVSIGEAMPCDAPAWEV